MATSDTFYGHFPHDGSLFCFNVWRLHTGGRINANATNGPNANGSMRLGLIHSGCTQFTSTQQWDTYPQTRWFTTWAGNQQLPSGWFAFDGRMVNACGIFCDDDFGGTINFSLP